MADQPITLTPDQVKRYSRHIIMGDVGSKGQRALMGSKALIIGAGGLGSPSAIYLSLAGVGTVGIVDFDVVELSNLQRQVLHHTADVGRPKVQSAVDNIKAYNPDVNVVVHETRLESDNAMEIISQYDLVINGADNFATRYLVNDACYLLNKPLVDGSILIFDGQATVFLPGEGCYRCLFPSPPPPGIPDLEETVGSESGRILTTRERLEMHRSNPVCAACHRLMDPIGLALDNFDVTGKWRIRENDSPLDTRSIFYDGTPIATPADLSQKLLQRPIPLVRQFTQNLMAFGLGRRIEAKDQPTIRKIVAAAEKNDYRMSSFVLNVVMSDEFRKKKAIFDDGNTLDNIAH